MIAITDEIQVTDETAATAAELLRKAKWTLEKCRKWGQLHHPHQGFRKERRVFRESIYRCKSCDHTLSECDMQKVRGLWDIFEELAGIREIIRGCDRERYRVFLRSQYVTETEIVIANRVRRNQSPGAVDVARLVEEEDGWSLTIDHVPDHDEEDNTKKTGTEGESTA